MERLEHLTLHPYATDSARGRFAIVILTGASVLFAWGLDRLLAALDTRPPWWLDTPAVMGFFGLLWKLYDRYAWRWRWRSIRISDVPDLAGRWDGEIQSSHNLMTVPAAVAIHQTATQILVELTTERSRSVSVMATLNCRPGRFQGLSYVFENVPRTLNVPGMMSHTGRAHMRIDGAALVGDYETDHHRGTTGRMIFRRTSKVPTRA